MSTCTAPVGGSFAIEETPPVPLIPEALDTDVLLMAESVEQFIRGEVLSVVDRIEEHEEGLMPALLRKAAALGLLGADVPEAYGGLGLSKSAITRIVEAAALQPSFSVSVGAHTVIGTLPILYFGTEEQRRKWLPGLASGELLGAFSLSEAGCGSDALSSRTKAVLSEDGRHYLLSGEKMWTTNAGFADLFTIFAKVDGEKFTAFVVEKNTRGLTLGREEHKLGIRGSSTRRVILEQAEVPVENVLGEVGQGHRVALYVLNVGRMNLGVGAFGTSRELLKHSAEYAQQRVQFGTAIANFGLIQRKLGEMTARMFALESMCYRTAGYWDVAFADIDAVSPNSGDLYRAATEQYAIECAILKFWGSEVLNFVADEGLQIHGGFGYTEEFPMARAYRDARINRIFEGTNEINRLTVTDQLLRRAKSGRLDILGATARVRDAVLSPTPPLESDDTLVNAAYWTRSLRTAALYVAGQAWEALGEKLALEQEICAGTAEILADLYAVESAWLRAKRLVEMERPTSHLAVRALEVVAAEALSRAETAAREAVCAFSSGDAARAHCATLRRVLRAPAVDVVAARRELAGAALARNGYPF